MFYRFGADTRGNIAIMFAFLIVPLIGAVGFSVDYGRAVYTRTSLQNAIDATALMLARDLKKDPAKSASDIQLTGQKYFAAQFNMRFAREPTITATYAAASAQNNRRARITISADAIVDRTLMKVLGSDAARVASKAEVIWGIRRIEVALVLDNSKSMETSDKMGQLKTATRSLLNILAASAVNPGDVKVAVVPYTGTVNVGVANAGATWLDWSLFRKCDSQGQDCKTKELRKAKELWRGCVADRSQDFDITDAAPGGSSPFPAIYDMPGDYNEKFYCPTASIVPLTDIKAAGAWADQDLSSSGVTSTIGIAIAAMTSKGATNGAIGMAWGWHALSETEPLTREVSTPAADKIIIMMTDGRNTMTRDYPNGVDPNPKGPPPCPLCDTRFLKTCANAKAAGITVYTVGVFTEGENIGNTLKNCASAPDKYNVISEAGRLNAVFEKIGGDLADLRLAK